MINSFWEEINNGDYNVKLAYKEEINNGDYNVKLAYKVKEDRPP